MRLKPTKAGNVIVFSNPPWRRGEFTKMGSVQPGSWTELTATLDVEILTGLRIDPMNSAGRVEFNNIRVKDSNGETVKRWEFWKRTRRSEHFCNFCRWLECLGGREEADVITKLEKSVTSPKSVRFKKDRQSGHIIELALNAPDLQNDELKIFNQLPYLKRLTISMRVTPRERRAAAISRQSPICAIILPWSISRPAAPSERNISPPWPSWRTSPNSTSRPPICWTPTGSRSAP